MFEKFFTPQTKKENTNPESSTSPESNKLMKDNIPPRVILLAGAFSLALASCEKQPGVTNRSLEKASEDYPALTVSYSEESFHSFPGDLIDITNMRDGSGLEQSTSMESDGKLIESTINNDPRLDGVTNPELVTNLKTTIAEVEPRDVFDQKTIAEKFAQAQGGLSDLVLNSPRFEDYTWYAINKETDGKLVYLSRIGIAKTDDKSWTPDIVYVSGINENPLSSKKGEIVSLSIDGETGVVESYFTKSNREDDVTSSFAGPQIYDAEFKVTPEGELSNREGYEDFEEKRKAIMTKLQLDLEELRGLAIESK